MSEYTETTANPSRTAATTAPVVVHTEPPAKKKQVAFTRFANCLIDDVMPTCKPTEWMILTALVRKITGFEKYGDGVAYAQLSEITGIKHPATIRAGTKGLEDKGIIHVIRRRDPENPKLKMTNYYSLRVDFIAALTGCDEDTICQFLKRQHKDIGQSAWKKHMPESEIDESDYETAIGAASRQFAYETADVWESEEVCEV